MENSEEVHQEDDLEPMDIETLDGSSVSSLSDYEYDEESIGMTPPPHEKVAILRTSFCENDSDYIASLEQRISNLREKNEVLRADKAVLEVDLLETQHETYYIIRNLKRQIFGLKESKAQEEKDLMNIIIAQEQKMKEDQVRFLEFFTRKDKEIAKLQRKVRSTRKSNKDRSQEVEAIAPSAPTSPSASPSQSSASTILEQFEVSNQDNASSDDDLITVNGRKEHIDTFPKVAKTMSKMSKYKLSSVISNDEPIVDQMKEKISSRYSSIGRILSKSTYQKMENNDKNDCITSDDQGDKKLSILLDERDRNVELMAKMQRTIETLCEALERQQLQKNDNIKILDSQKCSHGKIHQQVVEV